MVSEVRLKDKKQNQWLIMITMSTFSQQLK